MEVSALLAFDWLTWNGNRFKFGLPSANTFVGGDPLAPRSRWGAWAAGGEMPGQPGLAWSLTYLDNEFAAHVEEEPLCIGWRHRAKPHAGAGEGRRLYDWSPAASDVTFAEWVDARVLGTGIAIEGDPGKPTPCPLPRALMSELAALDGAAFVSKLKRAGSEVVLIA